MTKQCAVFLLITLVSCTTPPSEPESRTEINQVLDDWHDAAARADEERYFGHFATEAVFLGTDATERWDVPAFRAYAHPHFAKGKAWTFRATRRDITFGDSGVAWFDEALETQNMGPARGSGVLTKDSGGHWKIAQYNLAITVPNERFSDVKKILDAPR
jgi:ketosteroid isomerase-like protein